MLKQTTLHGWSVSVQRGQATVILRGKNWVTGTWRCEVYKIPVTDERPNNKALVKAAIEKSRQIPLRGDLNSLCSE